MATERVLASPSLAASGLVGNGGTSVYYGYTVTVVTAVAAINVRKGLVTGQIIDVLPIGTAAGATKALPHGLQCEGGVFVDFNGGTGTLVIHYEG